MLHDCYIGFVTRSLIYFVLLLTILKFAKEKVKEREESPERPGQVECKVITNLMIIPVSVVIIT